MANSLEMMMQIWNDETGERYEIGPDRDGIDMLEIRYIDEKGKLGASMRFTEDQVPLLLKAIVQVAGSLFTEKK